MQQRQKQRLLKLKSYKSNINYREICNCFASTKLYELSLTIVRLKQLIRSTERRKEIRSERKNEKNNKATKYFNKIYV